MKSIFSSKTVWFNFIMTVLGIVTYFQGVPTLEVYAPYFAAILAIGNVVLRVWFTTAPLK
jgi:uncharacterized membrane protein (DUF485 family)